MTGYRSVAQPGANASRCIVFVRIPQENAPLEGIGFPQIRSGVLSCGVRTKTVAEGGPWLGNRTISARVSPLRFREFRGFRGCIGFFFIDSSHRR
jgi:hypothetical protein